MAALPHYSLPQKLFYLLPLFLATTLGQAPVPLRWSEKPYGPDGPWSAMTVSMGNPAKEIDLYPAGQYGSFVFNEYACRNGTLNAGLDGCAAEKAGWWNYNSSETKVEGISYEPNPAFNTPLPIRSGGRGMKLDDIFMQYNGPAKPVHNASITSLDWAYNIYPGGKKVPVSVGSLCLGAAAVNWTFQIYLNPNTGDTATTGSINASVIQSNLWTQDIIPSASFGLHIGSVGSSIAPSLWQGGYDKSRALSPVISQVVTDTGKYAINLVDITIGVGEGSSIFSFDNKTEILRQGNSSIGDSGITVNIEPGTPYMFLPRSSCDAIVAAADLPVSFDEALGLYLWDSSNPRYHTVVSSASYLAFNFRGPDGAEMTVKAPWKLFNLTLTAPLVDKATPYFPCSPHDGEDYTLGRAFLQAAFLGTNWKPTAPPAYWFLAQAPGPNTATTALPASIETEDSSIEGLDNNWEETWDGYWTVKPIPQQTKPAPSATALATPIGSSALSTPLKAGIAVAAAVLLMLLIALSAFIYTRRTGQKRPDTSDYHSPNDTLAGFRKRGIYEKHGSVLCEADTWAQPLGKKENPVEADGRVVIQELPERFSRYEMPTWKTPKIGLGVSRISQDERLMQRLPPPPPPKDLYKNYKERDSRTTIQCEIG